MKTKALLQKIADEERRSLSGQIMLVLEEWMMERSKKK
jgi:hypothetical protein